MSRDGDGTGRAIQTSDRRCIASKSVRAMGSWLVAVVTIAVNGALAEEAQSDESLSNPVVDVRIEGNVTIPEKAILSKIRIQRGRMLTALQLEQQMREDVRRLHDTRWFFSVVPSVKRADDGLVAVYRVVERPILQKVEYRGNKKVKEKHLAALTGLKPGGPFDVSSNRESARRIESHYHEKGFAFTTVKLLAGDSKDDREVIFEIDEGPKVTVWGIDFQGNTAFSSALLRTKLQTKKAILGLSFLGGKYDPTTIPNDIASLKEYYNNLGYFDVKIDEQVGFSESRARAYITYTIDEGVRYQVRDIDFRGNQLFTSAELQSEFKLTAGDDFNARFVNKDVESMRKRYDKLGRLFAKIDAQPVFSEEQGIVDLVYLIDEDKPYYVRTIDVDIQGDNPHTKETVVLNRIRFNPGELASQENLRRAKLQLDGSQIFDRGPQRGARIDLSRVPVNEVAQMQPVVRGQNGGDPFLVPANPIFPNSPQGDPLGNALQQPPEPWVVAPSPLDIDIDVFEARTGRLMFGVGVNSDAGVVGSIVLDERNFDLFRPPSSIEDVLNGTAWRGGGQQFRLEAVPGNVVSRYLFSWTDPYFLDTDFSLGVSGFYYNRFFQDWNETRTGGRVSLGHQFTPEISLTGALRLEDVEIDNPSVPTPGLLQEALGANLLTTFRLTGTHDTRDTPFLPGAGHIVQMSVEQAFGEFIYPRLEVEGSQYFTVYSRPDGGGRHILSLNAQAGWTDSDTPIFERYYAGGFQTFRGFRFRGVTPEVNNIGIGGRWMLLGGAEYLLPVTADEMVSTVFFTDLGTVEEHVGVDQFRVSIGAGLRLMIPAMGPAPIALDFAYPLVREVFDNKQIFSFYVGFTR